MISHSKQLKNYSVYDITGARNTTKSQTGNSFGSNGGVLAQERYTPVEKSTGQAQMYYVYGSNNIQLGFDGQQLWRKTQEQDPDSQSQTITVFLTNKQNLQQYSQIKFSGLSKVMLASQKIQISRKSSSWYTWNDDFSQCTVKHNLSGYIDFVIRHNGLQQVFIQNQIIDENTIKFKFGNRFNTQQRVLLKAFSINQDSQFALSSIIDFDLYKFNAHTNIFVYNQPQVSGNLVLSGQYSDIERRQNQFSSGINYYVYAKTPAQYITDTYQAIIWFIGKFNSKLYSNVFTYQLYPASSCIWNLYENDQAFDLNIPYRFSFLGYSKSHSLDYQVLDSEDNFVTNPSGFADVKTVTSGMCITKEFLYTLQNKRLKVITPQIQSQEQCNFIIIYTSCFSQSYYCDFNNQAQTAGIWKTGTNLYNKTIKSVVLTHGLKGDVRVRLRNVRQDLYYTYIIDQNTVQIIFPYAYKVTTDAFWVDLFTIWKQDN